MNGHMFDKELEIQIVWNTLPQNVTYKERKNSITGEKLKHSTITQLSITRSGTYITYYPVEGMRPQSTSVIFCPKFITCIQLKRKRQTQTEAFATKYWALIIKVLTVPE